MNILNSFNDHRYSVKELHFDPVQTHAITGVYKEEVDIVKSQLKSTGLATRFRVVKANGPGLYIVCFKWKNKLK